MVAYQGGWPIDGGLGCGGAKNGPTSAAEGRERSGAGRRNPCNHSIIVVGSMTVIFYNRNSNYSPPNRTEKKMSHTETRRHGDTEKNAPQVAA